MKQGITPNQITILCINSDTKNIVENFIEIKHFIQQGVTVDSVRRYTGLENDVIILVIPDKSVFPASINDSKTKNYLYIAASRASSILSILSTKEFFEEFFIMIDFTETFFKEINNSKDILYERLKQRENEPVQLTGRCAVIAVNKKAYRQVRAINTQCRNEANNIAI